MSSLKHVSNWSVAGYSTVNLIVLFAVIISFSFQSCTNKEPRFDERLFELYGFPIHNNTEADSLIKYYDNILEKRGNMPYAHLERGYIHLVNKDVNKAETDFKQSLELRKENNDSYLYLATTYALKGEDEKAFEVFNDYKDNIANNQEGMRLYIISLFYFKKTEACQSYKKFIEKYEDLIPNKLSKSCK
ncbi:MAG: hypothetical protein WD048_11515 [Chitinophagales bacterium]